MYVKVGDDSLCIEHFGGQWQLKLVSHKGQNLCIAKVLGGCAFEACTLHVWSVWDGKTQVHQPSVKMLSGADAEREVSRRRLCARARALIVTVTEFRIP